MAKKSLINLDQREADLKRFLREVEEKKKVASGILKTDLPAAKAKSYQLLVRLATLGVAEDYKSTILHTAHACGEEGIRLPILRKVMPDQVALDQARRELGSDKYNDLEAGKSVERMGAGYLIERNDGNSTVITITDAGKQAFETQQK